MHMLLFCFITALFVFVSVLISFACLYVITIASLIRIEMIMIILAKETEGIESASSERVRSFSRAEDPLSLRGFKYSADL